jgi:hypothetical protein
MPSQATMTAAGVIPALRFRKNFNRGIERRAQNMRELGHSVMHPLKTINQTSRATKHGAHLALNAAQSGLHDIQSGLHKMKKLKPLKFKF